MPPPDLSGNGREKPASNEVEYPGIEEPTIKIETQAESDGGIQEELERIRESIQERIHQKRKQQPENIYPTEQVVRDGQEITVRYVPKELIEPALGYGGGNLAEVRDDLPPRVKKHVRRHEIYHCTDKAKWGGSLGMELRANFHGITRDSIGFFTTVRATLTTKERRRFYIDKYIKRKR